VITIRLYFDDIVWQNNDGTPLIRDLNGTSIIEGGPLPNPGPTWHVKDDGPISPDPGGDTALGSAAQPPALHLSTPDMAPAGAPGAPGVVDAADPAFAPRRLCRGSPASDQATRAGCVGDIESLIRMVLSRAFLERCIGRIEEESLAYN
jgi:hypothetical protein